MMSLKYKLMDKGREDEHKLSKSTQVGDALSGAACVRQAFCNATSAGDYARGTAEKRNKKPKTATLSGTVLGPCGY
jgi:hypothetical protein